MQEHGSKGSWADLDVYGTIDGGGMATIEYAGKATVAGRVEVALKRPRACFARDPEFAAMFLDEARLSIRIAHANVVRTLGVLKRPLALVLEYVPGESLHDLLQLARRASQPVPTRLASALTASVLHGLHGAHHTRDEDGAPLSIVHRDVTPGNILIGADGVARLLDFGIAKAAGKLRSTPCGEFKGKLAYVSPEQLEGAEATHQSDVYSAALVLWEMLAGRSLFDRTHDALTLEAILRADVPSLCEQRSDVSPALDAIVHKGLARDPRQRFADAAQMARALESEVGVAGQSGVMDWLEQLAGERLRERSARLQALRARRQPAPRANVELRATTRDAPAANGGGTLVSRPKDTVVLAEPTRLALQRASAPTRLQPSAAGMQPSVPTRLQPSATCLQPSVPTRLQPSAMRLQPSVPTRLQPSAAMRAPAKRAAWRGAALLACAALELGAGAWWMAQPATSIGREVHAATLETPIAFGDHIASSSARSSQALACSAASPAASPSGASPSLLMAAEPAPAAGHLTRTAPSTPRRARAHALPDFGPRSPVARSPLWLAAAELGPSLLGTGVGRR